MQVKADVRLPLVFAAVLALLLGYRRWFTWHRPVKSKPATEPVVAQGEQPRQGQSERNSPILATTRVSLCNALVMDGRARTLRAAAGMRLRGGYGARGGVPALHFSPPPPTHYQFVQHAINKIRPQ